jgi:hypothetical protein
MPCSFDTRIWNTRPPSLLAKAKKKMGEHISTGSETDVKRTRSWKPLTIQLAIASFRKSELKVKPNSNSKLKQ